jgi:hypothetical protein
MPPRAGLYGLNRQHSEKFGQNRRIKTCDKVPPD